MSESTPTSCSFSRLCRAFRVLNRQCRWSWGASALYFGRWQRDRLAYRFTQINTDGSPGSQRQDATAQISTIFTQIELHQCLRKSHETLVFGVICVFYNVKKEMPETTVQWWSRGLSCRLTDEASSKAIWHSNDMALCHGIWMDSQTTSRACAKQLPNFVVHLLTWGKLSASWSRAASALDPEGCRAAGSSPSSARPGIAVDASDPRDANEGMLAIEADPCCWGRGSCRDADGLSMLAGADTCGVSAAST